MHNVTKVFPHEFLMIVLFYLFYVYACTRGCSSCVFYCTDRQDQRMMHKGPNGIQRWEGKGNKDRSTICSQQKHAKKIDDTSLYIMSVYPYIHTFYLNVPFHHQKWIYHNQITVYSQLRRMYIRAKANCKMKYQRPSKGKNKIVNKLLELCS